MTEPAAPAPTRRRGFGGLIAVIAIGVLAGAALVHRGSPSTRAGTAAGRVGAIRVTDAYIPAQTSATVAAAYLTIRNTGSGAETLEQVTTDRAPSAQVMREVTKGGVSSMTQEPGLVIPGHGTVMLTPGIEHLMLVNPPTRLIEGEVVNVTLRFARSGTLTLAVPVTAVGGP